MNNSLLQVQRFFLALGLVRGLFLVWWQIDPGLVEFCLIGGFGVLLVLLGDFSLRWWMEEAISVLGAAIGSIIVVIAPVMFLSTKLRRKITVSVFCVWGCKLILDYFWRLLSDVNVSSIIQVPAPFGAKRGAYAYYAITQTLLC